MIYQRACLALTSLLLASTAGAGDVLLVTPFLSTGDFAEVQSAVDAASDGDVILIRNDMAVTSLTTVVIDNKSLTLVADPLSTVPFFTSLTIQDLPANKSVQVSGIGGSLTVESALGDVLIQDHGVAAAGSGKFATVRASANVVVVGSRFAGNAGGDGPGGTGFLLEESNVTMYACTVAGGDGGYAICLDEDPDGGDGVHVFDNSTLRAFESAFVGGYGGFSACSNASRGSDLWVSSNSTFVELTMAASQLNGPAVVREGELYSFAVEGPIGQSATLLVSTETQGRALPPEIGVLHMAFPANFFPMGPVLASGMTSLDFTAPNIGAGDESRLQFDQGMLVAGNQRYLTNPRFLVVIDASL